MGVVEEGRQRNVETTASPARPFPWAPFDVVSLPRIGVGAFTFHHVIVFVGFALVIFFLVL